MSELNHQKKRPRKRTSVINFPQTSLNQVAPEDSFVDNLHIHSDNASAVSQLDAKQEEFQKAFRMGSVIGILPLDAYSVGIRSDIPIANDKLYISRHPPKEWYIIRYNSWIVDTLHVIAALCAIWNLMEVPVDIAFQYSMVYSYGTSFDIVVDVLVWLYIALLFFVTVITSNDIELTDLKDIAAYRVASKSVWVDVLTSLPYEFMWSSLNLDAPQTLRESYAADVSTHVMIQLLRLPKILRAANTLRSTLNARQATSLIWSLIKLILIYLIVLHFLACGLYFVGMYQIGPDDPKGRVRWVDLTGLSNSDTPLMYQYTLSLYWSLIVITGTGFGDITAVTLNEKMFMILCLSCTVTTSALLFSGLFSIIEKMDAQNAAKQTYKEELMTYLELEKVEKSIVGTLLDNTEMYLSEEFVESSIIVERTPVLFQNRIHRAVYLDPLSTFALTNILSERCRHALCSVIKIEVACVDELLSVVGDIQTQLYMIMRGAVSATDPEKGIEYGVLRRGGFFGELAMMSDEILPKCRAPTLKAKENCCFATISRSKLRRVLCAFPDDALLLEKISLCRARIFKHNTLPILEPHEKSALFLMNVVAAIGSSNSQASGDRESNDMHAVLDSEPQLLARRSRAAKRISQDNARCKICRITIKLIMLD
jgi:CRP-like cAMP-binding protein